MTEVTKPDSLLLEQGVRPLVDPRARWVLYQALYHSLPHRNQPVLHGGGFSEASFQAGELPPLVAGQERLMRLPWEEIRLGRGATRMTMLALHRWLREQELSFAGKPPVFQVDRRLVQDSLQLGDGIPPLPIRPRVRWVLYQALCFQAAGDDANSFERRREIWGREDDFRLGVTPRIEVQRANLAWLTWSHFEHCSGCGRGTMHMFYDWLQAQGLTLGGELPEKLAEPAMPKPNRPPKQSTLDAAVAMLRRNGYTVIPPAAGS